MCHSCRDKNARHGAIINKIADSQCYGHRRCWTVILNYMKLAENEI